MIELALASFATFFATIGPLDVAAVFASLTLTQSPKERTAVAVKGAAIATAILLPFALFGEAVLDLFGISLAALRIGGGILLFLMAVDLVFARPSGATTATPEER